MKEEGRWIVVYRLKNGNEYETEMTTSEMMEMAIAKTGPEVINYKKAEA